MIVPISNAPRDYAWGDPRAIADLQGREPGGSPEAEVWLGDHPGDPAEVDDGSGLTLDAWIARAGGRPLPFLLKILAAASPLSIQAHPSRAQALAGFAREEAAGVPRDAAHRNYRDDNHKPEVIVALSDEFQALAGFRALEEIDALLDAVAGQDAAVDALREALAASDPAAALRELVGALLSGEASSAVAAIEAGLERRPGGAFADDIAAVREIARVYPGDPGVVVALLLNRVVLRRGEALFVPAGMPHAYLSGLGVELMAASDNVMRGGLTPKHVDVPELLAVLDCAPGAAPRLSPSRSESGVEAFTPPIPDFALARVQRADAAAVATPVELAGPAIVLATAGAATVRCGAASLALSPGSAAFVDGESEVSIEGAGEVFVAQAGGVSRD
jgi:mannose-6-phosphate isomerase